MSRFEESVLTVLAALEPGDVLTYGEVAEEAGFPGAARAVGNLLGRSDGLPWWRVVGAGGKLVSPSRQRQADLLRAEGVLVMDGRVSLSRTGSTLRP